MRRIDPDADLETLARSVVSSHEASYTSVDRETSQDSGISADGQDRLSSHLSELPLIGRATEREHLHASVDRALSKRIASSYRLSTMLRSQGLLLRSSVPFPMRRCFVC